MWKGVLSANKLAQLSKCYIETVEVENKVVSWENLDTAWFIGGDVYLEDVPSYLLCDHNYHYNNNMLIMHKTSYNDARLSCDQVGGTLPVINQNRLILKEEKEINELMKNFTTEQEYNNCITENGKVLFWLGQYKESINGEYINPYDTDGYQTDFKQFIVPKTASKCVYALGDKVFAEVCTVAGACGICKLGESTEVPNTILKMKGICGVDLFRKKNYDLDYYVYGVKNSRPYFR